MTKEMKTIGGFAICAMIILAGVTYAIATDPPIGETGYEAFDLQDGDVYYGDDAVGAAAETGYIVRSSGGTVCVYTVSGEKLSELDIRPAGLRSADAAALRKGIAVADDEALARLIEDFSS